MLGNIQPFNKEGEVTIAMEDHMRKYNDIEFEDFSKHCYSVRNYQSIWDYSYGFATGVR